MSFGPTQSGARPGPIPQRIGRYELRGHLGSGAMGDVFLAWDPSVGREVALKTRRGGSAERFLREAQLMAGLDSPGIVRVLDAGADPASGLSYYACERVEGARDLREAFVGLTLMERVELVRDAARAIGHAHERGIVHRDLKPENILVDARGLLRITDFGLASAEDLERLTRTGALLGTPTHLAPEQWRALQGERVPIDPRSDVWALGVVLYEALTGELPFEGASWVELSDQILAATPTVPSSINAEVPRALQRVCLSALSLEPERRPQSGEALAAQIEEALGGSQEGSRRALLAVGALALALLAGALGWVAKSPRTTTGSSPPPPPPSRAQASPSPGTGEARDLGALVARAREQRAKGDHQAALQTINAALAEGEPSPEVLLLRAQIYVDLGDPPRAVADLNEALKTSPEDTELLAQRAQVNYERGNGGGAGQDVQRALAIDPEHVPSLLLKAALLIARGEVESGILLVEGLASKHPERADVWIARGAALFRQGKPDLALRDLERALEIDPNLAQAYSVSAAIHIARGENEEAKEAVLRGLEIEPGSAELWTNCGVVRMRERNYPAALEALNRALTIHPGRALALANRGFVRRELGRRREALGDFRLALEQLEATSPSRKPIQRALTALEDELRLETLGQDPKQALTEAIRLRAKRPARALSLVDRVLRERPDDPEANYLRGNLLVLLGRHQEAIAPLTRAIELDGTKREHFNDRGMAYQGVGDQERAIKDFDRVVEGWPDFARGWSNRAISRRLAGDYEGALADCDASLERDPRYVNAVVNRANALISLKRFEEAEAECDRALALETLGFVHGLRGMVRHQRGNHAGAKADYERFLELTPKNDRRRAQIENRLRELSR